MLGKGRKFAIAIAIALCVGTLAFAGACKKEDDKKYTVTYEAGYTGATEEIPAESYAEGETVTLRGADTYTRDGYLFVNWSDGSSTYAAGASYTMPARDVVFTAQWQEEANIPDGAEAETIESFPAGNLTLVNGNATAHYTAEYADVGLVITAWVEDKDVSVGSGVSGNDGVSVIFAKQERIAGVSEKTYRVRADLDGNVQAATMHNTQPAEVTGLTAEAKYLTLNGRTVAGYRIKLTMPYAAIDVTKESHNAVVALGFQNADQLLYDESHGTEITQSHTYLLVNADGTFAENPDLELGKVWGNGGTGLQMVDSWDVTTDDGTDGAYIEMAEARGGTDNNIYMHHSNTAKTFYAETELTVKYADDTLNGGYDQYPKFGVAVYNASGSKGVLFYVDAVSNEAPPAINANSTNLGYNIRANGNWGTWNNVGRTVGENAGVYQSPAPEDGQEPVENYVKMGIYRQGAVFKLVYNGEAVHTLYGIGIAPDEDAYFCIISFNLVLKARNYSYTTDEATLQKYYEDTSVKEEVDYLFMGDSYMDTAFFQTYADSFGKLSSVDLGVGGTKVEYWQEQTEALLPHYLPKNVIIHIGVNNLDDAGQSDTKVIGLLGELFKSLHQLWPEAKLYYISIVDNVMFHQYANKYEAVNAWVETQTDINFIDMRPYVTKTDGAADRMWFYDGLHYSPMGYALLVRTIADAVGADVGEINVVDGLGNLSKGDDLYLTHSANFDVEGEGDEQIWHALQQTAYTETLLPIDGAYGANVYAEAKLSVKAALLGDAWGKAGLAVSSKKGTYFYFINLANNTNPNGFTDHYGSLVWRPESGNREWDWKGATLHFGNSTNGYTNLGDNAKYDYNKNPNDFITLGAAKVGKWLYFTADGQKVGVPVLSQFDEDEEVSIFVLNFNMELYVKGGYATTTLSEINTKAPMTKASTKNIDGDLSDWTDVEKNNPHRIPLDGGRSVTAYAFMDTYGVNIFYDVIHNTYINADRNADGVATTAWHMNTNVEMQLGGDVFGNWSGLGNGIQVFASADSQKSVNMGQCVMKTEQLEGGKYHTVAELFVSYDDIPSYDGNSDYIPVMFAFKTSGETASGFIGYGDWWRCDDEGSQAGWRGAEITKKGIRTGTVKKIDGDLSDWTDETFNEAGHNDKVLSEAKYSAFLGDDGMYLALRIKGANGKKIIVDRTNTAGDWWKNTNIEFFTWEAGNDKPEIGHWAGKVMTFGGQLYHTGYITAAEMKVSEDGNEVTFEIFISNRWLRQPQAQSIYIDFCGRTYVPDMENEDNDSAQWYAHDPGYKQITRKA